MLRNIGKYSAGNTLSQPGRRKTKATVGRICRKGRFEAQNKRLKEWGGDG